MRIKRFSWKKGLRTASAVSLFFLLVFMLLNELFPFKTEPQYSTLVLSAEGKPMAAYLSQDEKWRLKLDTNELTEPIEEAFLLKEDHYFYFHPGFNPAAMLRALWNNVLSGKRTSGASTITMQLARMLEPKPRSYGNKLIEVFRAMQLEWRFTKEEILRMYLNQVPYGGNIEGIKAASYLYLGKSPLLLSPAEIAALTVIPNRPTSLGVRSGERSDLTTARNYWLKYFAHHDWVSSENLADALREPVAFRRREMVQVAPHLCRFLKSRHATEALIYSSVSLSLQQQAETLVANYMQTLYSRQISNAAVVVLNNANAEVLAYVGSADFNHVAHQGQVDGTRAIRSPGSTLKPLLYAYAMEKGFITPLSQLSDVPSNFGGYTPENYDSEFNGKVSLKDALAKSLNIPAVKVLSQTGIQQFTRFLSRGGFHHIKKQKDELGLSLILGGCGVSLLELCEAYMCLANYGEFRTMRFVPSKEESFSFQWTTPEASFMTSHMLADLNRPDIPAYWRSGKTLPHIAWKTGTSYGRKDAWSIGYNDRFTVGVWVGNFDASGVPDLSGADIATPLLFKLFENLPGSNNDRWLQPRGKVDMRWVCSETGQYAGEQCENQVMDYYIPGISSMQACQCKKAVWVDEKEKQSYCMTCKSADAKLKYYRHYPPELLAWFQSEQKSYEQVPEHNPNCSRVFQEGAPQIVMPTAGATYLQERGSDEQFELSAQTGTEVSELFWYVDDALLGKVKRGEAFFTKLKGGAHKISCVDDKGRLSHITILVNLY